MGCLQSSCSGAKKSSRHSHEKIFADGEIQTLGTEINVRTFASDQKHITTIDYRLDLILDVGRFGWLYRGRLRNEGQYVAIKEIYSYGRVDAGTPEFFTELETLSRAHHPNIVKIIGYLCEGEDRLLVYEDVSLGFLDHHLHGSMEARRRLDWNVRVKIAAGAAHGLEYLHYKMKPQTVHCDIQCANILLDKEYNTKLTDFGFPVPKESEAYRWTKIGGPLGHTAPEYYRGQETLAMDVYGFGVALLEIFTGRKAFDITKPDNERFLASWSQNLYNEGKDNSYLQMADPILQGQYPEKDLKDVLAIALMCVEEEPEQRPLVTDIVTALNYIARQTYDPQAQFSQGSQGVSMSLLPKPNLLKVLME